LSESDSFMHEVSEEVRRDKLFAFFKKYAWIFALVVIGIVGGAAYNEYSKTQTRTAAQAAGEALLDANEAATSAAFAPLAEGDAPATVIAKMNQAAALVAEGQVGPAAAVLDSIAADGNVPALYRDLALLKLVMINGANMGEGEVFEALDKLIAPNAPFRLLAMEQRAIVQLRNGDIAATLADLAEILKDDNATQSLRNRAQELTIALGGEIVAPTRLVETSDG